MKVQFESLEKTLMFIFQDTFFGSYGSSLMNYPSNVQCTAMTDCVYEEFLFQDYQTACATSLLINKIGRVELEKYFLQTMEREKDFLTKTTEERYIKIVEKQPEIMHNIPLKSIANYLGVLPETLSRIRKKVFS